MKQTNLVIFVCKHDLKNNMIVHPCKKDWLYCTTNPIVCDHAITQHSSLMIPLTKTQFKIWTCFFDQI